MKYRILTIDELKELEQEFVRFLASHSITADDWIQIKKDKIDKANSLIEIFSDIVFDKILSKVDFLEHRRTKDVRVYQLLDDKIIMLGIIADEKTNLDFTQNKSPQEMLIQLQQSGGKVNFFSGEKKFKFTKEKEAFLLMEEGALISKDSTLFNALKTIQKT